MGTQLTAEFVLHHPRKKLPGHLMKAFKNGEEFITTDGKKISAREIPVGTKVCLRSKLKCTPKGRFSDYKVSRASNHQHAFVENRVQVFVVNTGVFDDGSKKLLN